ncbi:MAG: addiction module protein [Chitinophagales bacterium]|nr:addiction module protein [Hyphomicrobiales bacterium]
MNDRVRHLTKEAAKLTPEEQAELIDALLALGHEPTPEWEKAWAEEAERRLAAYDRGETKGVSWEDIKARRFQR